VAAAGGETKGADGCGGGGEVADWMIAATACKVATAAEAEGKYEHNGDEERRGDGSRGRWWREGDSEEEILVPEFCRIAHDECTDVTSREESNADVWLMGTAGATQLLSPPPPPWLPRLLASDSATARVNETGGKDNGKACRMTCIATAVFNSRACYTRCFIAATATAAAALMRMKMLSAVTRK
jgi:hypothetical protein